MIVWHEHLVVHRLERLMGEQEPGSSSSGFDVAKMLASVESPGAVRVGVLEEAVSLRADTEPGRQEMPGARQLVGRTGGRRPFSEGPTAPVCSWLHTNR